MPLLVLLIDVFTVDTFEEAVLLIVSLFKLGRFAGGGT